jgi:hypothetical protein
MLVALMAWLLAGCIVIPAKATVAQSGGVRTPSGGVALSVLFSYDSSPETPKSLGEEMIECVTRGLTETAPGVRLVPEEEFHLAVFGVKPGEVMLRADTIATLLARPDIKRRVGASGLTHLILVGGATRNWPDEGFFVGTGGFGAGVAVGWTGTTRSTRLTASIFELASGGEVGGVQASAEGSQGVGMLLPIAAWGLAQVTHECGPSGEFRDWRCRKS